MSDKTAGFAYIPQPFVKLGLTDPVSSRAFQEINRLVTYGGDQSQMTRDDAAFNRDLASVNVNGDEAVAGGIANATQSRNISQLAANRAVKDQATGSFEDAALPAAQKDKALTYDKWLADSQSKEAKKARNTSTAATIASIVAIIAMAAA
jgi:hypothetical protein